jgi:hypothetical protein
LFEQKSIEQDGKLPAFVAGATIADGEIYFNASGKKIVNNETSGDVDPDSVFWICSMTKMLTHVSRPIRIILPFLSCSNVLYLTDFVLGHSTPVN